MEQITGGDWYYEPRFSAVVVIKGHEVKAVADFGKCDLPEVEANARIIAAAPKTRALLAEALEFMGCMGEEPDCPECRLVIAIRQHLGKK